MYVVRMSVDNVMRFQAFQRFREARACVRQSRHTKPFRDAMLFRVANAADEESAVIAVRDGLGVEITEREADPVVMLASMGLGTGLRI